MKVTDNDYICKVHKDLKRKKLRSPGRKKTKKHKSPRIVKELNTAIYMQVFPTICHLTLCNSAIINLGKTKKLI